MSESRVRVVKKTVEHRTVEQPMMGQRVVRTVVTNTSSGDHLNDDLFSKFSGMNLTTTSSSSSSHVTRTVQYVTKEGTVTKKWTENERVDPPSVNLIQKTSPSKVTVVQKSTSPVKIQPKPASPVKVTQTKTEDNTPKQAPTGNFAQDCLKWHNHYRAKHGVPPLTLSSELCRYADEWARNLSSKDIFQHRSNNKYGENIYMEWSSNPNSQISGQKPVDSWYSEISMHQFGKEPTSLRSGHFTQVIWKASKEVGMAYSQSKSGKIYVVANYNPAGNMIGSFKQNVPPPSK